VDHQGIQIFDLLSANPILKLVSLLVGTGISINKSRLITVLTKCNCVTTNLVSMGTFPVASAASV